MLTNCNFKWGNMKGLKTTLVRQLNQVLTVFATQKMNAGKRKEFLQVDALLDLVYVAFVSTDNKSLKYNIKIMHLEIILYNLLLCSTH